MNRDKEQGSATLIGLALLAAGLAAFLLSQETMRTNLKAREIRQTMAAELAQQSNLAAISYFHASLEDGLTSDSLLKIEDNKIVGNGNARLRVEDSGSALYFHPNVSALNYKQIRNLFAGTMPIGAVPNSDRTRLRVLETKARVGHATTFLIEAATDAKLGKELFAPVTTVARLTVNFVDENPPPGGQKEFEDCETCIAEAKLLTATLGYEADPNITVNFGFYKVKASSNLCDIHFLKKLGDRIEDHDGKTSVLNTQIAVYCPCDCLQWRR